MAVFAGHHILFAMGPPLEQVGDQHLEKVGVEVGRLSLGSRTTTSLLAGRIRCLPGR